MNNDEKKSFDKIIVVGAKENNLKNVLLEKDNHKFNVVTGVSGSGKSSLVFDCIYAMAQTSFYEALSTYIVKNLPKINRPNVDRISNLSPCVLVEQRKLETSPRSTIGTYTEIYTYLRLLYSRIGYLTLNRGVGTLSGGESQKIKLAKSINNTLNELVYILDEPSLGFHSRDVNKIIDSIKNIVDNNNTAIVVEHNREIINSADNIIDIGPELCLNIL